LKAYAIGLTVISDDMNLDWKDIHWEDPDGGTIVLHGVLPTVVMPSAMRPRDQWHGLGLLCTSEEPEVWAEEEKAEKEDAGVNLDSAILGGGIDSFYLEMLSYVEDLQVGRFPDPEPRRLHRNAQTHSRPIYFAEPDLDDEDWVKHIEKEVKMMTSPRRLLAVAFTGRRWRKRMKMIRKLVIEQPARESNGLQAASALAATWWSMIQESSSLEINIARNNRFASRLRGGLVELREDYGKDAILLVPMTQAWRSSIQEALERLPEPEEVSSSGTSSHGEEE